MVAEHCCWVLLSAALLCGCAERGRDGFADAPAPGPAPAGRIVVCVPTVRDEVGDRPDAADAATRMLLAELLATGRYAVVPPQDADLVLERLNNGNGRPTAEVLAELGRRLNADVVLTCSLVRFRAEASRKSRSIPLGVGIPYVPVGVPGLGGLQLGSDRLQLEAGLEARALDVRTTAGIGMAKGFGARNGRRSKVTEPGGERRPLDGVLGDAAADLVERLNRGPLGRWNAGP